MPIRWRDFINWQGTLERRPFLVVGVGLSIVKYALDSMVAERIFGRPWSPYRYVFPTEAFALLDLPPDDRVFFVTMALLALPFLWIGVLFTVKRLRDIPLPSWLVVVFFAPAPINVLFLLLIGALPSGLGRGRVVSTKSIEEDSTGLEESIGPEKARIPAEEVFYITDRPRTVLGRLIPENDILGGLAAILLSVPVTIGLCYLGVAGFQTYGWAVFLGIPFAMPMISVLIYGLRRQRSMGECLVVGSVWAVLAFFTLFVIAFEGLICLVIALPLVAPVVLLGTVVGYSIQLSFGPSPDERSDRAMFLSLLLVGSLPLLMGAEAIAPLPPPLFEVRSVVEIDAPAERVWQHVVEFSELPPPDDWVLWTGIAYPIRAEIEGEGPGAIRHCVFSTGAFVEPIEVWDEPRLLRFAVTRNPPPMREWSPIADIHPPHLDNYLVARRGQFLLEPLPGGRTRLEGTTWYHHNMWPSEYWKLWSDQVIRRIHLQVLRHVQRLSEAE
ncbi:hypothetical protein BH23PLA1_BH23PLA1_37900 [soil metagenome]